MRFGGSSRDLGDRRHACLGEESLVDVLVATGLCSHGAMPGGPSPVAACR